MKDSSDGFPSEKQSKILDMDSRIGLVQAGPGSGKTRLFVEKTINKIKNPTESNDGVLALSLTNAAKDVIEERLKNQNIKTDFPHYIGTFDSFLFNFIIRPFGPATDIINEDGVRLISGNAAIEHYEPKISYKLPNVDFKQTDSIYKFEFTGKPSEDEFWFKINLDFNRGYTEIRDDSMIKKILIKKKEVWQEKGLLTHSDCRFLAFQLLKNFEVIENILVNRFPIIFIDELQDIGLYLGRFIYKLLINPEVEGFLVGDRDQAIYHFHGATGEIFTGIENIEGCKKEELDETYRFGTQLCDVSEYLRNSSLDLSPNDPSTQYTDTLLLSHHFSHEELSSSLSNWLRGNLESEDIAVLVRKNKFKDTLSKNEEIISCPYNTRKLNDFDWAIRNFRSSKANEAFEMVESILIKLIFDRNYMDRSDFDNLDIDYLQWKEKLFDLLQELSSSSSTETWGGWVERLKQKIEQISNHFDRNVDNLGNKLRRDPSDANDDQRWEVVSPDIETEIIDNVTYKTIHQSKGDQFNTVCLVLPVPGSRRYTSKLWFDKHDQEERNIAYVAMTRATDNFILCLHEKSREKIVELGKEDFLNSFNNNEFLSN